MKKQDLDRRKFIGQIGYGSLAVLASGAVPGYSHVTSNDTGKLAILGGQPVRANKPWPTWPHVNDEIIKKVLETTRSGAWSRIDRSASTVATFEKAFAELLGTQYCVATGSGTQALSTCVEALGIDAGDEVITSPYTDMGTVSSILTSRALPVLADLDPDTYQLDPDDVERRITPNTKAIMPVHIMGQPCHMDRIMEIAKKHTLFVIEDACQGLLSRYKGKRLGTIGDVGCFSFQASKAMACGEGGALVSHNSDLVETCFTVQNRGTNREGAHVRIGAKYRMNEFEGAVLLGQMEGVKNRYETRNRNADYLTGKLQGFEGLRPQKMYEGTESGGYYTYAMSYKKEHFNGASRAQFLKAMAAEGVPLGPYIPNGLHTEPWVTHICSLPSYVKAYGQQRLAAYREAMDLPNCDLVCSEMTVIPGSGRLLVGEKDMDDVANAIMKVYENRDKLSAI